VNYRLEISGVNAFIVLTAPTTQDWITAAFIALTFTEFKRVEIVEEK